MKIDEVGSCSLGERGKGERDLGVELAGEGGSM